MDFSKYEVDVIKNIDKDNMNRIISFLESKGCSYIAELLEDYLDIFSFDYDEFVLKFNRLNEKYNNLLLAKVSYDMNILEEFYYL